MALFDKSINALKKNKEQEQNQSLMKLIKRVHSVVENTDIEKHRQSQDYFGALLGNSKEMDITSVDVEGMHGEWVRVNRVHMKKYVILYCHGGGYSTGSCVYARTLTTKLACGDGGCHESMELPDGSGLWRQGRNRHRGFRRRKYGAFPGG